MVGLANGDFSRAQHQYMLIYSLACDSSSGMASQGVKASIHPEIAVHPRECRPSFMVVILVLFRFGFVSKIEFIPDRGGTPILIMLHK